jgi:hypothetical protein
MIKQNIFKLRIFLFLFLFMSFCFLKTTVSAQDVKAGDLKEWVSFLASDNMRGRANGSPEMKIAADWISKMFGEAGLKPVLPDGSFIQNYSFTGRQQQKTDERNVIGMIPGSDPALKDQYIFLTAHFDHIGIRKGASADSICNGADDNAAGTTTLIAIAKAIKESSKHPGRSIVFAAFSGEERGMRGSRYFVANPPVPLKDIYADLNFEMTGHSESYGKDNYYMTGCKFSNLDDLIKTFSGAGRITLIDTIQMAGSLFYASDNIAFSRISVSPEGITTGIPSGTFATTTMAPYIHSVTDEADKFDYDNMAELTSYFTKVVLWLSESRQEINWTDPLFTRVK